MNVIPDNLLTYINTLQPPINGRLGEVQQKALADGCPIIRRETATFLNVLMQIKKPKYVLEIGCAVGFSASLFAQNLEQDGNVTTIERYNIMANKARENFKYLENEHKITLIEADAIDVLPTLEGQFDYIFLDAAKAQYINYLPYCVKLLSDGGLFIVDDVLQGGTIADDINTIIRRQRTIHKRMNEFLDAVYKLDNFKCSLIPIGDGLLLAYKTKEI